jgi:CMP-N,N'-diacetyllegionaminic acid synthase
MPRDVILGAICARGGSKGVPRKNLRHFDDRPLIAHTIACGLQCQALHEVVVSTEDPEIAEAAEAYGAIVPFMRPAELARDDSSKWAVFRHLVRAWEALERRRISVLVDLDTGVPLRRSEDIDRCVALLLSTDAEVVVTAYAAERNPYFNMVEGSPDGPVRLVKGLDGPVTSRQAAPPVFSLSPSVFAIRREALWRHPHWSEATIRICLVPRERAMDIDTELDFALVEHLARAQKVHD